MFPILKQPGLIPPTWKKTKPQRFAGLLNTQWNTEQFWEKWSKTNSCRSDDCDTFLIGCLDDLPGVGFGDAFCDDGNGVNLKAIYPKGLTLKDFLYFIACRWCRRDFYLWVLHGLHGAVKGWAQRGKVDEHIHIWVFLNGIAHVLIHRDEDLFVAPVELLFVVSTGMKQCRIVMVTQWKDFIYEEILKCAFKSCFTDSKPKKTKRIERPYVNG